MLAAGSDGKGRRGGEGSVSVFLDTVVCAEHVWIGEQRRRRRSAWSPGERLSPTRSGQGARRAGAGLSTAAELTTTCRQSVFLLALLPSGATKRSTQLLHADPTQLSVTDGH